MATDEETPLRPIAHRELYDRLVAVGKVRLAKPGRVRNFSGIAACPSVRDPLDVLEEMRGE